MKKIVLMFIAILSSFGGVAYAAVDLSLTNDADLNYGYGSSYNAATKTITFTASWKERGWSFDPAIDISATPFIVVEFASETTIQLDFIYRANDTDNTTTFNAGTKKMVVDVRDFSAKNSIQRITFKSRNDATGGSVVLSSAKLMSVAEYTSEVFAGEGTRSIEALDLANMNQNDDNTCTWDNATHVASYTVAWKGIGWWINNDSYKTYKSVVFLLESTPIKTKISVSGTDEGDASKSADTNADPDAAGATFIVASIEGYKTIKRLVLTAKATGSVVIKKVYVSTYSADAERFYVKEHAYPLVLNASGYASFSSDKALDFSTVDGLEAYTVSSVTASAVNLTKVNDTPASTGIILKGTAGVCYEVPLIASSSTDKGKLTAAVTATTVDADNHYVLFGGQFKKFSGTTIPAGKAYLSGDIVPAGTRNLDFVINETITGVENVKAGKENNVYYNLQGHRVLYPKKGLYIMNGKKVVIK